MRRYKPQGHLVPDVVTYAIGYRDHNDEPFEYDRPPYKTEQEALDSIGSYHQHIVRIVPFGSSTPLWWWDIETWEWVEYDNVPNRC